MKQLGNCIADHIGTKCFRNNAKIHLPLRYLVTSLLWDVISSQVNIGREIESTNQININNYGTKSKN
jgi:hypothetical protein